MKHVKRWGGGTVGKGIVFGLMTKSLLLSFVKDVLFLEPNVYISDSW